MPALLINLAAFLVGLCGMEAVAWASHRFLMHGPLWVLHGSHHEARRGGLELNDLFAVGFAAIAVALFWFGARPGLGVLWWLAGGVTAYGALYALVHDGLVHRRFPFPVRAESGYLLRLVRAHNLHHLAHTRQGAVSFGFLLADDPERLQRKLTAIRREPHRGPEAGPR